jgi:multidrug efflux pump subunit AcrB
VNRAIEWFAKNRVAANLLMALILAGGVITVLTVKLEVFPEVSQDLITVSVEYLGAAPEEVEEAVCQRIEEAIEGLDGVKKIVSNAQENFGVVNVELQVDADSRKVLDDIKNRVDAIDTFPEETEKPVITEITNRRQVVNVAVYGDTDEASLKVLGEKVRDEIGALPGITLVELTSARPYEISIEVSEDALRRHGLSFDRVAQMVRRSSIDLPGGSVKTSGGEILLRTKGQAYRGPEFESLVLLTRPDGTRLKLGDVATVIDGFEDTDVFTRFDGKPAVHVAVFRTGNQDALEVAATVEQYIEDTEPRLPEGIRLGTWQDSSKILRGRLSLLLRNGAAGFVLVFISLSLFLRFRLAFWVSLGIPISFMGAIWLMPTLDVSVNLISLFAFIVVLGIVVDDAIIVGENIFTWQQRTGKGLEGSIVGAQQVMKPVMFAVLTTVAAFAPLFGVEGNIGKIMAVIPLVVIPCLVFSLIESLLILPAHLSHRSTKTLEDRRAFSRAWRRFQSTFSDGLLRFVQRVYRPSLEFGLRRRYATLAVGLSTLLFTVGMVRGGWIAFQFFPDVESDFVTVALTMPQGTPVDVTSRAVERLERSAEQVHAELLEQAGEDVFLYTIAAIGEQPFRTVQAQNAGVTAGALQAAHLGEMTIELTPAEDRRTSSEDIVKRWRELAGSIPDAEEVKYSASLFSAGEDINIELTGPDLDELQVAASEVKRKLAAYQGVYEISDSFREGKREVKLRIKPQAELVGLTLADLGRQVRQAFYGEEAQRIQRGRDELRVMVRYPKDERRSLGDLENMRIRLPDGLEVPFSEVAEVDLGRGYASITRVDRRRSINVTADVDNEIASVGSLVADLDANVLPEIVGKHESMFYSFEGAQAQQRDTMGGLIKGFALAMVAIYALLAVPLRSYSQPIVIMLAIPFGLVGAAWGHVIMGLNLTIMSMFGIVALAGVVVNDSLVMVDFINRHREEGGELLAAVRDAGTARFRPIMLTSVTTFLGLTPLLLEKSMQAKFLIPMAVSLAFGVLFSTFISLVLVPSGYLVLVDLKSLPAWLRRRRGADTLRPAEVEGPADAA